MIVIEKKLKTGNLKIKILKKSKKYKTSDLFDYSSRINKKRGFLFVSKVLGKHYPSSPSKIDKIHKSLALKVKKELKNQNALFIGFAETAVGLGQGVFEETFKIINKSENKLIYQHSTRFLTNQEIKTDFQEEHCHAPNHIFYKIKDKKMEDIADNSNTIVLIDDELSTGNTMFDFVSNFKKTNPLIKKVIIVSILNWITENQKNKLLKKMKEIGVEGKFISLLKGEIEFTWNEEINPINTNITSTVPFEKQNSNKSFLTSLLTNNYGRYGVQLVNFETILHRNNINYKSLIGKKVLVLGTAEFMYIPFLISKYLSNKNIETYIQSTTRSPINLDGAIRSSIIFKDNYFEGIDNFLYNVVDKEYDKVFICYETKDIPKEHNLKEILKEYFKDVEELFF